MSPDPFSQGKGRHRETSKVCGGSVEFCEDIHRKEGLVTHQYLCCTKCGSKAAIQFARVGTTKKFEVNVKSVLANKCVGGSHSSLDLFCTMMDLPLPVSPSVYCEHAKVVCHACTQQAGASMKQASNEVRQHYDAEYSNAIEILVSCDGTWQKRGFTSLYGAVFVIAHETGKVLDYRVMSKECAGCRRWEGKDTNTREYDEWKSTHICPSNYVGSSAGMEPTGLVKLFQRSLDDDIIYKYLVSDGDSKAHSLILKAQPYGEIEVEKKDCIGHVQKRMGSALRNLKTKYRGQKLSDGKTIGGQKRLTDTLMNSLQNYYGDAIRKSVGNVERMVKSVQATLLHLNSTDETPRHQICPEGKDSWCAFQAAKAKSEEYHHTNEPIPEAIVHLLKPIYARLGDRALLEKCVDGYTQNANESLHSLIWKLCPKVLHLGKVEVDTACALAVCAWYDGMSSCKAIAEGLGVPLTKFAISSLQRKDIARVKKARYRASVKARLLRRKSRRRRKGLNDKHHTTEGVMYSPGGFDSSQPGPSSQPEKE